MFATTVQVFFLYKLDVVRKFCLQVRLGRKTSLDYRFQWARETGVYPLYVALHRPSA